MTGKQKAGWALITVLVLLWCLFPVLSILMNSFKSAADLTSGGFLPSEFTWENYEMIFVGSAQDLFVPALRNSIGITLIATLIAVVLATLCAYAIARLQPLTKGIEFGDGACIDFTERWLETIWQMVGKALATSVMVVSPAP